MLHDVLDICLLVIFLSIFAASVWLTYASRGVQFRALRQMWRLLWQKPAPRVVGQGSTISPRAALLTAMSTTVGVGNVAGPLIAVGFGGPGALLCYVLASVFGGAMVYSEVALAMEQRRRGSDGSVEGGPTQYIRRVHPRLATVYAVAASLLLLGWSASNANTITLIFAAEGVPKGLCGAVLAVLVFGVLVGGITRIARLNELMVPTMCALYCLGTLTVIGANISELPHVLKLVLQGFVQPQSIAWGVGAQSIVHTLRWGMARAMQANEAGVGTSSIPHSMSHSATTDDQATLAMAALYFNGLLCVLTGLALLVSGPFAADTVFDINLLRSIFTRHLSSYGGAILGGSILLFAFGTIVGNSFNGSQCCRYLWGDRSLGWYFSAAALATLAGSLFDLRVAWSLIDYLIVPVALINSGAVVYLVSQGAVTFGRKAAAAAPDVGHPTRSERVA